MEAPKIVANYHSHNAEVPLWHAVEQCLYWADIPRGHLFRYDPAAERHEQVIDSGEPIGGMTIQEDGSLLLFKSRGTVDRWFEGKITTLIPEIFEERDSRFNDAIADPDGRVYSGTMATSDRPGSFYRIDPDGSLTKILDETKIPNGMGFVPDQTQLYYTDSTDGKIYLFYYDRATGNLSNQRVHIEIPEQEGVPDGMTVDAEGYIWSARWDGGHLFRYAPDGSEVLRIPFPAKKVSCVTFGGADYTDIYVTTAGGNDPATEGSGAGALFHLNLGIPGVPEFLSRIGI